jgi:hypothetical protein
MMLVSLSGHKREGKTKREPNKEIRKEEKNDTKNLRIL